MAAVRGRVSDDFAGVDTGGGTRQHIATGVSSRVGQRHAGRHQLLHQQMV